MGSPDLPNWLHVSPLCGWMGTSRDTLLSNPPVGWSDHRRGACLIQFKFFLKGKKCNGRI